MVTDKLAPLDDPTGRRIILVDFLNMFIRNYAVIPTHNPRTGEPNGGTFGTLRSLTAAIRKLKPTDVVVVTDGAEGSVRRRSIFKDYKGNRKPFRTNRFYNHGTEEDVHRNMLEQGARVRHYFENMPIAYVSIDRCEADDVIAYLATDFFSKEDEKFILSSDKDFYQLCSDEDNTYVYNQASDVLVTEVDVLAKFGVSPANTAVARALDGDGSDNIPGIKGLGMKSITKCFPELAEPTPVELDQIIAWAVERDGTKFDRIVEQQDVFYRNYKLMQLADPMLSPAQLTELLETVTEELKRRKLNQLAFRHMLAEDSITSIAAGRVTRDLQFITEFKQ